METKSFFEMNSKSGNQCESFIIDVWNWIKNLEFQNFKFQIWKIMLQWVGHVKNCWADKIDLLLHILLCVYFVLFKIVPLPKDCVFSLYKDGKSFKFRSEHGDVSADTGRVVLGISHNDENIGLNNLLGEPTKVQDERWMIRRTKNILFSEPNYHQHYFLVRFWFQCAWHVIWILAWLVPVVENWFTSPFWFWFPKNKLVSIDSN